MGFPKVLGGQIRTEKTLDGSESQLPGILLSVSVRALVEMGNPRGLWGAVQGGDPLWDGCPRWKGGTSQDRGPWAGSLLGLEFPGTHNVPTVMEASGLAASIRSSWHFLCLG